MALTSHGAIVSMQALIRILAGMAFLSVALNVVYHSQLPDPLATSSSSSSSPNGGGPAHLSQLVHHTQSLLWKSNQKAMQVTKKDRKGNIVHQGITHLTKEDLQGLDGDNSDNNNNNNSTSTSALTLEEARRGREELVAILEDAGVEDMDPAAIAALPTWDQVLELYGDGPVVYGLETCQQFRDTIPGDDASIGPAGLFNTGTNPFAMYLMANCVMPDNTHDKHFGGMRWQVPWGKHMLADRKWTNTAGHEDKANKTNVLPVVMIRDPYSWMQSMCKHPYAAKWAHNVTRHCPNLVPTAQDIVEFGKQLSEESTSVPVEVGYPKQPGKFASLAHFWSEWYKQYLHADFPRLIVRFEDLIFHQKELISTICECGGAKPKAEQFSYVVGEGKWGKTHEGSSNLISGMIKYGSSRHRLTSLTAEDLQFAAQHIDPHLMELFQYAVPHATS